MSFNFKGKVGFCIGEDFDRISPETAKTLMDIGTPALSDGLNKFNSMHNSIKPVAEGVRIAGSAMTVKLRPADNLMLHKAIELAHEGDILVVDTCGCESHCVMGDLMASCVAKKNLGGVVIDGYIRDVNDLKEKKFPIFAKGVINSVGDKDGPGEINMPISCGGVAVLPGDVIVGDENGVVVIRPNLVEQIIEGAHKKLSYEAKRAKEIEDGMIAKADINEKLKALGIIE